MTASFGTQPSYRLNGDFIVTANTAASAIICVAGNKSYFNGNDEGLTIPDAGTTRNAPCMGAFYNGSTAIIHTATYFQAAAYWNTTLTPTQVAAITTAMQAL
jgi:hypothetical protein